MVKSFNGGQDCAGPDAILVHHNVSEQFISMFVKKFSILKTGPFTDPATVVGPVYRFSELQRLASLIHRNSKDVIAGGTIDYKNSIVAPTVIVRGVERYPNYKEIYGPIAFIHTYNKDADLSYYFADHDGNYNANKMYVSVYGDSSYISARNDSTKPWAPENVGIVLHNQTIHDVEIGYNAYGGYSMGASGLIKKSPRGLQKAAMPILLPQVIADYLINNEDLPSYLNKSAVEVSPQLSSLKEGDQISPIILDFQRIVTQVFQTPSCPVFSFVFGSAAKGKLRAYRDDLDTFVCLNESNEGAVRIYNQRLSELHAKHNLKIDEAYPSEVMTLSTLNQAIEFCRTLEVSIYERISGKVFDNLFWVHSLSDKKAGFMGDGKLMSELIKKSQSHVRRWSLQIIDQITNAEELPAHLKQTFSGLSKGQIIEKLKSFNPHLVVHLGLSYLNNEPSFSEESATKIFSEQSDITFFSDQAASEKAETVFSTLTRA